LWAMVFFLIVVLGALVGFMPRGLPTGRKSAKFTQVFARSRDVNWLSAARVFLFGSRDVWFVVGIPIYFTTVFSDGTPEGNRAAFFLIGTFMAVWIILYGAVQASAPRIIGREKPLAEMKMAALNWVGLLFIIPFFLAFATVHFDGTHWILTWMLVVGLLAFGAVFAVNSSLHSYLILALSKDRDVTMDVGFYYMANAGGRLLGTLLSGASYQIGGLPVTLGTAALMIFFSWLCARKLAQV